VLRNINSMPYFQPYPVLFLRNNILRSHFGPCTTLEGVTCAPEAKGRRRFNTIISRRGSRWLPADATVAAANVPGHAGILRMSEVGALLHATEFSHANIVADARFSILHNSGIFDGCGGGRGVGLMNMGEAYTALREMGCVAVVKEIPRDPVIVKNFDGGWLDRTHRAFCGRRCPPAQGREGWP